MTTFTYREREAARRRRQTVLFGTATSDGDLLDAALSEALTLLAEMRLYVRHEDPAIVTDKVTAFLRRFTPPLELK